MNRSEIELLPALHDGYYSSLISDYLLEKEYKRPCLELLKEVERYVNEYAKGKRSYERLKRILIGGSDIRPFEKGYRPLLRVLPELNERINNFKAKIELLSL